MVLAGIVLQVFSSCSTTGERYHIESAADAKAFVEKETEKHVYETKIKEVNFKLKHITNPQMALQQISDIETARQSQFDSLVKAYEGFLFFNLEIKIDDFNDEILNYKPGNGVDPYSERIDYYAFKMQKDITLVLNEKDTVPCILYHYERTYGVSPESDFMIGFKPLSLKNAVLVYDNRFLTTGTVKFALNEKELTDQPQIKIH